MKQFKEISPESLQMNPFHLIGKEWMLVTAGDDKKVNTLTASWGGLGIIFNKNVAYILVRPQRYTKEFIDREESLSLSFLPEEYRKTLNYLGTVSGRDEDKIAKSGLTVVKSDNTPYFNEANLVLICKKLIQQPFSSNSILAEEMKEKFFPNEDYHTLYIAEITKILQATD